MTLAELRALCERSRPGEVDSTIQLGIAARTWLPALIEVAEAARTVGTFDDFGDPEALCPECSPAHPQPFMDARMALHAALARLDEMR